MVTFTRKSNGFSWKSDHVGRAKKRRKARLQQYTLLWVAEGGTKWSLLRGNPTDFCGKVTMPTPSEVLTGPPNLAKPEKTAQKPVNHTFRCFPNGKVHKSGVRTVPLKTLLRIPRFQLEISESQKPETRKGHLFTDSQREFGKKWPADVTFKVSMRSPCLLGPEAQGSLMHIIFYI